MQFSDQSSKPNKTIIFHNKKELPRTNSNPNQKHRNFALLLLPQNSSAEFRQEGKGGECSLLPLFYSVQNCFEISVLYKPHISLINWHNTILEDRILVNFKLLRGFLSLMLKESEGILFLRGTCLLSNLLPSTYNAEENLISFPEQALYLSHLPLTLAISPSTSRVSSFTEGLTRAILIRYSLAYLYT